MQNSLAQAQMMLVQPSSQTINAENAAMLKQQLAETVSSTEYSSLLVDMRQVESLDSEGLMVLISTLTLAQRLNKQFGLFGISPSVRIVLELTQLDRVFEIFENLPGIENLSGIEALAA
ncbi:anti-anti-sigma factor [filamentous cyanobacterium CCP1]|nr:anti-anti-sigma factor [filamentous cyanobacterium CCP2]PSB66848.1 anti-anti-sigma factor [filamentous cyanobacterium CCP1]